MKGIVSIAAGLALMGLAALPVGEKRIESAGVAEEMADAASNFLAALSPDQQRRATYLFKDEERRNFHFFPVPRRGVPLKELNAAQRQLGHALVSTGLSARGYLKAVTVMSLGQVLRDLTPESPNIYRDSDQYYFTIFGKPGPKGTWGWRTEGFHLSLNFTIVDGKGIAAAPSFFGSLPATVQEGPRKGLRALAEEEDLGRRLITSLGPELRRAATGKIPKFEDTVGGLLTGNARKIERGKPQGVPLSRMSPAQAELLKDLVREYARRHRPELANLDLAKIEKAGWENVHFRWAGGTAPGEPHHYLIQGPTFLIEYDNTQDEANHVHSVWRDFDNDFGKDLLRHHYRRRHGR